MVVLVASGSVADYDAATRDALAADVAQAAGVDASRVRVSVEPASVIITFIILVPPSTTASAVQAAVASSLGTPAQAHGGRTR